MSLVAALFGNAMLYLMFAVAEHHGRDHQRQHVAVDRGPGPGGPAPGKVRSWKASGLAARVAGAALIFTPWRTASGLVSAGSL
jgi:hypothetical protein